MINTQKLQRLVIATAFAMSLLSAGVAASAQTAAAPANPAAAPTANTVAVSTVDGKSKKQMELDRINTEARRVEFRNQGTSL